jgi:DNA primase
MDPGTVVRAVGGGSSSAAPPRRPDTRDPVHAVQREALKCVLQEPALVSAWYASVEPEAYSDPALRSVHDAIAAAGGPRPELTGLPWIDAVLQSCPDDEVRGRVRGLAVEPLPVSHTVDARYATSVIARLLEMDAARRIGELRGRLQRLDEGTPEQAAAFADLMALEAYRRDLRDQREG